MSSKWMSNEERKKQMKENIILHRRKVLYYLENAFDTDLKPKVKSAQNELLGLDMFNKYNKQELDTGKVLVKEEIRLKKERDNLNECESDVSVGSIERWNGVCQTSNLTTNIQTDRRSSRRLMIEKFKDSNNKTLYYDKSKADYVYNSSTADVSKRKRLKKRSQPEVGRQRFKEPLLRKEHNAKERACRSLIATSFIELGKCCSYLDTKRRIPSKYSILVAAKKECDSLKIFEKKLLVEKEYWLTANEQLKRRLDAGAISNSSVITIDD